MPEDPKSAASITAAITKIKAGLDDLGTAINADFAAGVTKDAAQDAKDAAQDTRLAAQETKDAEQDGRLTALEDGDPDPPDPPEPPVTDYPNESNTGAKGTLTVYNGDLSVGAGQTVRDKRINGNVRMSGKGCKLINCEVNPTGPWGIDASGADGSLLEDVTVTGKNRNDSAVYMGTNSVARRIKLAGYENGLIFGGGTQTLEDSLIWRLRAGASGHYDGAVPRGGGFNVQQGGQQVDGIPQVGVVIRHNTIMSWDTSCVFCKPDFGPVTDLTIDNNQLLGDDQNGKKPSYPVYAVTNPSMPEIKGVKITNNKIQKGMYGYASLEDNDPIWTGNVDADTGAAIPKPAIKWNTGNKAGVAPTHDKAGNPLK